MSKINPLTAISLLDEIKNQDEKIVDIDGVSIQLRKNVFPPKSDFSRTSYNLHKIFGNIKGLSVLDVGTGTGIQAIRSAIDGAGNVIALDINSFAVECARENVLLNNVRDKVTVIESDLFDSVKDMGQTFDIVIANLPITDYPIEGVVESALYDSDYKIHKRFFNEVGKYLKDNGHIIISHINFDGENSFLDFENMIKSYGYISETYVETNHVGYLWRNYRLKRE